MCSENEPLSLHALAHKAKSSVAMLGIKDMEEDIIQIEQDSKYMRNLDELPTLVGRVKRNCQVVYGQLMDAIQRPAA